MLEYSPGGAVTVPEKLLHRLVSLKARLSRCGAVVTRREPDRRESYCVRYRDEVAHHLKRPHRSIPLGDNAAVAEAVREMLAMWKRERRKLIRAEHEAHRSLARAARLKAQEHRRNRKIIQELGGGGRRRRRRIGREYDAAVSTGPHAVFAYVTCNLYARPNRPSGRPRQGGLVLPS